MYQGYVSTRYHRKNDAEKWKHDRKEDQVHKELEEVAQQIEVERVHCLVSPAPIAPHVHDV